MVRRKKRAGHQNMMGAAKWAPISSCMAAKKGTRLAAAKANKQTGQAEPKDRTDAGVCKILYWELPAAYVRVALFLSKKYVVLLLSNLELSRLLAR